MTKLALDSFLPSGAFDIPTNGPIAGTACHSGLDSTRSKRSMAPSEDASSSCGRPASCQVPAASLAHDSAMQSPALNSPNSVNYFTAGFLASRPSACDGGGGGGGGGGGDGRCTTTSCSFIHPNLASLSPPSAWEIGRGSLARSVSVDAVSTTQPSSRFYSGLDGYSSLVERKNLDALRRRAEQLYRDQQAVIDEMSDEWLKEKAEMLQLIHLLREHVQRLEGENTVLKSIASHNTRMPGLVPPQNSLQSAGLGALYGKSTGDVPIIDVHELDPKLEGIPIKATAVHKPTFEPSTTRAVGRDLSTKFAQVVPPANEFHQAKRKGVWGAWEREKLRNDRRRSGLAPLTTTRGQEQVKNILAADESRRLTMHAGHTPNHSLSLFPTMTATESSPAAARSRETTPSAWPASNHGDQHEAADEDNVHAGRAHQLDRPDDHNAGKQMDGVVDAEVEGLLEPADDVPLRGPLMIKNIPAQDEIFWARVNQLLDPISRGKDALPKVLQSSELDATQPLNDISTPRQEDAEAPGESSAALPSDNDDEAEDDDAAVEADVSLVFKATSNFGTPFGSAP
ncbi:hypothetical protein E4U41_005732 [Claviceps citrina]|nr:hypothetical protein E4U41_005732 [Claviceps citrina]